MAKLLNNLPNGELQFWMEVEHPIPSYAVIDGRRVKIWHAGQKRTCARCCLESDKCPGKANAKLCDENGGLKAKTEVVWAETLKKLGYVEYDGEIKDIIEDTGEKDEAEENIFTSQI